MKHFPKLLAATLVLAPLLMWGVVDLSVNADYYAAFQRVVQLDANGDPIKDSGVYRSVACLERNRHDWHRACLVGGTKIIPAGSVDDQTMRERHMTSKPPN